MLTAKLIRKTINLTPAEWREMVKNKARNETVSNFLRRGWRLPPLQHGGARGKVASKIAKK